MTRIDLRWALLPAAAMALAACDKAGPADAPATVDTPTVAATNNAPQAASPTGQDWSQTVSETPEGGYRMGNPDAPVKLVEYASLTCPHCADFAAAAAGPLTNDYVRTGKVSWEYRTFVLNSIDVAASLMTRCQGAGPFFKLVEQVYSEQTSWVGRFQAVPAAEQTRIAALPPQQQFVALAKAGGLDQFFGSRGVPTAKADACLADKAGLDRLIAIRDRGTNTDNVTGTPSFLINGKNATDVFDWPTLKTRLDAELK